MDVEKLFLDVRIRVLKGKQDYQRETSATKGKCLIRRI